MALTDNVERTYTLGSTRKIGFPVKGGERIFRGAAVVLDAGGFIVPATGETAFAGFAVDEVNATDAADGELEIEVYVEGDVELVIGDAITLANRNADIEASDDDTFRLAGSIVGLPIGSIVKVTQAGGSGANMALVHFKAASLV